jgi:hypothetical protein
MGIDASSHARGCKNLQVTSFQKEKGLFYLVTTHKMEIDNTDTTAIIKKIRELP